MGTTSEGESRSIRHPRLGMMRWDALAGLWVAAVNTPLVQDRELGVAASDTACPDFDLAADFLDWLPTNAEAFKKEAARQAFNYDLIWDDDLDEAKLASRLAIHTVNVRRGLVEVWFDTGGATTDHLLLAKLDARHKIVGMDL